MRSLAIAVDRRDGERIRRSLSLAGCLRTDLRIRAGSETISFPLNGPPPPEIPGQVTEEEFAPVPKEPPRSYRDRLVLDPVERARLPRAFDVVGDVVLIRLPEEARSRSSEVGRALLDFVPGARIVGLDLGVHGTERLRRLERIAGSGGWTTRHSENGLSIEVDLERAYFSPRLAREHARVAGAVRSGETVYDLCCGVGPFALTIARGGLAREVVAVDVNPAAVALLERNVRRLGFAGRIRPVLSSLEAFLPSARPADRTIFNLPREGIKYLASVATTVGPGGTLHYYEITGREMVDSRSKELADLLGTSHGRWTGRSHHVVHPYAPSADLVAYELRREAA